MESLPQPVLDALEFERSNYAAASAKDDSFYRVPKGTPGAAPSQPELSQISITPKPSLFHTLR